MALLLGCATSFSMRSEDIHGASTAMESGTFARKTRAKSRRAAGLPPFVALAASDGSRKAAGCLGSAWLLHLSGLQRYGGMVL